VELPLGGVVTPGVGLPEVGEPVGRAGSPVVGVETVGALLPGGVNPGVCDPGVVEPDPDAGGDVAPDGFTESAGLPGASPIVSVVRRAGGAVATGGSVDSFLGVVETGDSILVPDPDEGGVVFGLACGIGGAVGFVPPPLGAGLTVLSDAVRVPFVEDLSNGKPFFSFFD
jgi:hypothetical protein